MQSPKDGQKFWERVERVKANHDFARIARKLKKKINRKQEVAVENAKPAGATPSDWPSLAAVAVLKIRPQRKMWESVWAKGTGKTWKGMTGLPKRLRTVADEIERLRGSGFFTPSLCADAMAPGEAGMLSPEANILTSRFRELPELLRIYAAALNACISSCSRWAAETFPEPPPRQALFVLSESVKALTGRYHDNEVSQLLNAAAIALDETREFDATTIAQARSDFKKKKT